jgi:hypothetical protein
MAAFTVTGVVAKHPDVRVKVTFATPGATPVSSAVGLTVRIPAALLDHTPPAGEPEYSVVVPAHNGNPAKMLGVGYTVTTRVVAQLVGNT